MAEIVDLKRMMEEKKRGRLTRELEEAPQGDFPSNDAGLTIDDLKTGKDFNNYHGDVSFLDIPIPERMRRTEKLLQGVAERLLLLILVLRTFVSVEDGTPTIDMIGANKNQLLNVLWPVVYDIALINLKLDNYVFYFDLNTCDNPVALLMCMAYDTHQSVHRTLNILHNELESGESEWFTRDLAFSFAGLSFLGRKLAYDIAQLDQHLDKLKP